jgi:hypothetical protein
MRSIVRKRLVALLSAAGLAGTATSTMAQVVKGSEPGNQTKTESTIKTNKNAQENKAATKAADDKWVADKAAKHTATTGKATTQDAYLKSKKSTAESDASKNASQYKPIKSAFGSGGGAGKVASHDINMKNTKGTAESNANKNASQYKELKSGAGASAAQSEANKKANQATPK